MKKGKYKFYNLIFPIWLLIFFPPVLFISVIGNIIIDFSVLYFTFRHLKIENIKQKIKMRLTSVVITGFICDIFGAAILMFLSLKLPYEIASAIMYNPFDNLWAVILTSMTAVFVSFLIYKMNSRFSLKALEINEEEKRKTALALAVFTCPLLFLLPTEWFR